MSMVNETSPTLSVDAEGSILTCAKGVDLAQCGFVKGDKVCGKCGAVPVEMKIMPVALADELISKAAQLDEELKNKKKLPAMPQVRMEDSDTDEAEEILVSAEASQDEEVDEEESAEEEMPEEVEEDTEEADEEDSEEADEEDSEEVEEEVDEDDDEDDEDDDASAGGSSLLDKFRKARLQQIGVKSLDVGQHGYKCAIDTKVYAGGTPPCADCSGGCSGPGVTLLHAEGISQTLVKGDIVDSAYIDKGDMFVTTIRRKDGKIFDVYVDNIGEIRGHSLVDSSTIYDPNVDDLTMVTFDEAANIAMMHLQRKDAEVVGIQPAAFEGHEAYVVDIQCKTGESYDIFVGLDGTLLGYETLQDPDIEEIEAEAAEIALKTAYPQAVRHELAKAGIAMPDGSFPILGHNDLMNAIQASKRATNQKDVRGHIVLRAKTIGYESTVPASWTEVGLQELQGSLEEFDKLYEELDTSKE
jgi:hypothetical protein